MRCGNLEELGRQGRRAVAGSEGARSEMAGPASAERARDGLGWPESGTGAQLPPERLGWPDEAVDVEEMSEAEDDG